MTTAEMIDELACWCIDAAIAGPGCHERFMGKFDAETLAELAAESMLYIEESLDESHWIMARATTRQLKAASTWTDRIIDAIYARVGVRRPQ